MELVVLLGGFILEMFMLYVPGYLTLARLSYTNPWRWVLAPCFSLCYLTVICTFAPKVGISLNGVFITSVMLIIGLIIGWVTRGDFYHRIYDVSAHRSVEYKLLGLSLLIGVIAFLVIYGTSLSSINSFNTEFDNLSHINRMQYYLQTGNYSAFLNGYYTEAQQYANPFYTSSSAPFYPSVWHQCGAVIASMLHLEAAAAEHFANMLFAAGVYPVSMYAWLRIIFKDNHRMRLIGALVSVIGVAYPWKLLAWGPLYPNMAAYALLPLLVVSVMSIVRPREGMTRGLSVAVFFFGGVALAATQPNAVFSAGVLAMTPLGFVIYLQVRDAYLAHDSHTKRNARLIGALSVLIYAVLVFLIWDACFHAGPLQAVINFTWPAQMGRADAIYSILTAGYNTGGFQLVLGILTCVGGLRALIMRRYRSFVASYAILCLMYISTVAYNDGFMKHFLTGFWYTDPVRIAALCAIAGIPLAVLGIDLVAHTFTSVLKRGSEAHSYAHTRLWGGYTAAALVLCVLIVIPFSPEAKPVYQISWRTGMHDQINSGMASVMQDLHNKLSFHKTVLDEQEVEFIDQVEDVVESDAAIANIPDDGSVFAPFVDDANVYYRDLTGYGGRDEKPESELIRERLVNVAHDDRVKEALEETRIRYVLILENDEARKSKYHLWSFFGGFEKFSGIYQITDSTPGFELVLEDRGMKLYRITALDSLDTQAS